MATKEYDRNREDCFGMLVDPQRVDERIQTAAASYGQFEKYWMLHNAVRERRIKGDHNCPNLEDQVRGRAVDAERDLRILLKDAVDSLNELSDSESMGSSIEQAVKFCKKGGTLSDLHKGLELTQKTMVERYPDLDFGFVTQALRRFDEYGIEFSEDRGRARVRFKLPDQQEREFLVSPKRKVGQQGRIGSKAFLDPGAQITPGMSGHVVTSFIPVFFPDDCHHRQQVAVSGAAVHELDLYQDVVGSFAIAKQSMYRHVRKVSELGLGRLRGQDPITAILIIGAVVAAALVVAGVTINIGCQNGWWTGDVCNWGWGLIFAGVVLGGIVCVASGGCELVLAYFIQIVV